MQQELEGFRALKRKVVPHLVPWDQASLVDQINFLGFWPAAYVGLPPGVHDGAILLWIDRKKAISIGKFGRQLEVNDEPHFIQVDKLQTSLKVSLVKEFNLSVKRFLSSLSSHTFIILAIQKQFSTLLSVGMTVADAKVAIFSKTPSPTGTGAVVLEDPTPTAAVPSFAASANKQRSHVGE